MAATVSWITASILFSAFWFSSAQDIASDRLALIDFMISADPGNKSLRWNTASLDPCSDRPSWPGVNCSKPDDIHRVTFLELQNMDLQQGRIAANTLSRLDQLRVLRLINLNLSGTIPPDLSGCIHLKKLILSRNKLTGNIPRSLGKLTNLDRLMLDNNLLSDTIPQDVASLHKLLTLRLDYNFLTGTIPDLPLPSMTDFSVSYNRLNGSIPPLLASKYTAAAFEGNDLLCGPPTNKTCDQPALPPISPQHPASPDQGHPGRTRDISQGSPPGPPPQRKEKSGYSTSSIIVIAVFCAAIVVFIALLLVYFVRQRDNEAAKVDQGKTAVKKGGGGDIQGLDGDSASLQFPDQRGGSGGGDGDAGGNLVFVDGRVNSFELKELLRASAEMLGKGTVGTTYKAVMGEGVVFAVKRLIDRSLTDRVEFERQLAIVGKLKHPNILPLVAYYFYAQEEKLLIYDFHPNNNLYARLHANRGTDERVPLVWSDRLQIAAGVAQGLEFLHRECPTLPHGNLKSTNIVFDDNFQPCIADFGLLPFMDVHRGGPAASDGYRAPEMFVAKKVTHKADVYSFGVMLLELLTGRVAARQGSSVDLPRWVNSTVREEWTAEVFDYELAGFRRSCEEEMVYLLRIALDCVASNPEQRPRMSQVVKLIEDIKSPELSSSDVSSFSNELPRSIDLPRGDIRFSHSSSSLDHHRIGEIDPKN